MKSMNDFFEQGLIVHRIPGTPGAFDAGDCSAECGRYWFALYMMGLASAWPFNTKTDFLFAAQKLEIGTSGVWRRHPDQYNQPEDYSRDQQLSIQCVLALHGQIETLKRMIYKQWSHFGKYQNRDIRTWEWAFDFRTLSLWFMYPLICALDIGLLIGVLIRMIKGAWNKDDVADDLNLTVQIVYCNFKYPTPLSWLAKWIYGFRDIQRAWDWYYRHPENPPMNDVYRSIITGLKH
jgi:uncharacterized membrane protein